jgi:hypothetical protein
MMGISQKLSERVVNWLEKRSDKNLLIQFKNRLTDMPSGKRLDLKKKGYIDREKFHGVFHLTEEGQKLLETEIEPPIL